MSETPSTGSAPTNTSPDDVGTNPLSSPEPEKVSWFDRKSVGPLVFVAGAFLLGGFLFQQLLTPESPTDRMKESLSLYGIEMKDDAAVVSVMDQCKEDPKTLIKTRGTFGGEPDKDIVIKCDPSDNTKVYTAAGYVPRVP